MQDPLNRILELLTCTGCRPGRLSRVAGDVLLCGDCAKTYRIINNVPCFVPGNNAGFSEVGEADRQMFLEAKRVAYSGNSFIGRLYNHYHEYAASRRGRLWPDSVTIDVGFGIGEHFPFVSARELAEGRFIGVDTDRFKLEHFNASHPEMPVIQASALELPFGDASIDAVQMLATLEHFDASCIRSVLMEAMRVLKPGGYLVACYPAEGSMLLRAGQIMMHGLIRMKTGFDLEREQVHRHHATAREVQSALLSMPGLRRCESVHYPLKIVNLHLSLFMNELYRKEVP